MKFLFGLLVLAVTAFAQTDKDKLTTKAVNLGITFFNKAEIDKIATCMEPSFYDTKSMDDMKTGGIKCVMGACNIGKYAKGLGLLKKMDSCLKPTSSNTFKLVDKIFPHAKKAVKAVYDTVMGVIKKAKGNKKAKDFVIGKGYNTLNAVVTRNLIESVCKTLVAKLNDIEWKCVKEIGKEVINFDSYACAKIVKKN